MVMKYLQPQPERKPFKGILRKGDLLQFRVGSNASPHQGQPVTAAPAVPDCTAARFPSELPVAYDISPTVDTTPAIPGCRVGCSRVAGTRAWRDRSVSTPAVLPTGLMVAVPGRPPPPWVNHYTPTSSGRVQTTGSGSGFVEHLLRLLRGKRPRLHPPLRARPARICDETNPAAQSARTPSSVDRNDP
jgi:hypothetical protein